MSFCSGDSVFMAEDFGGSRFRCWQAAGVAILPARVRARKPIWSR